MIYNSFYVGALSIIPKGNLVGEIDVNPTFHYNENKRE